MKKAWMKKIASAALIAGLGIGILGGYSNVEASESEHIKVNIVNPQVKMASDITYKTVYGGLGMTVRDLKMDVLQQPSEKPLPALVYVTGGGFIQAPKSNWIPQRVRIAEAGYIVASVEYRIVPEGTYIDAVQDVKAAIRYLRAHAKELNIDPERIAVIGESAGGYMSAMIGTSNGVAKFDVGDNLDQSSDVQAAIDIYGLSDLTKVGADFSPEVQELHRSASASEALFVNGVPPFGKGGSIESDLESAQDANPMTYISSKSAPFLLMHGDADTLVSPSQTAILHDALEAKGISSKRYIVEGADHAGIMWYQPQVTDIIIDFLNQKLK